MNVIGRENRGVRGANMRAIVAGLLVAMAAAPVVGQGDKQDKNLLAFSSDLYPLRVGNRWVYQGNDPREKIVATVDRMEPVKRKVVGKGGAERTELIESYVLKITNGDKSLEEQMLVTEDGVYRYAAGGKEILPPLKILKLPVKSGESWSSQSVSEGVTMRGEFVVTEGPRVNVPGKGESRTWEVKTRDFTIAGEPMNSTYWFAEGIGVVKQHVQLGKYDRSSVLESYKLNDAAPTSPAPPTLRPGLPTLELK